MRFNFLITVFLLASIGGCASSSGVDENAESVALPAIAVDSDATSPCRASLPDDTDFAIVDGHAELIAVLDRKAGNEICVDTFDTIETILGTESDRAEFLWRRYMLSLEEVGRSLGQVLPQE